MLTLRAFPYLLGVYTLFTSANLIHSEEFNFNNRYAVLHSLQFR